MPICTTCTSKVLYLYTIYESSRNLRLEQCTKCLAFADPYVEHDVLTLVIDLILLKRGVYRHLLYNRGAEPRRALGKANSGGADAGDKKTVLSESQWFLTARLGGALIFLDAFIRWSHMNSSRSLDVSPWSIETISTFTRTLIGCFAETSAFHGGIILSVYLSLLAMDTINSWLKRPATVSDTRAQFRISMIPLSLFYSSLTKLFLLFLLTIWKPSPSTPGTMPQYHGSNDLFKLALDLVDDRTIDREWIVRNILGGMSAGFGLRVILDSPSLVITVVILAGWVAKTVVASLVSRWVGGDEAKGEAWLAYSIP